MDDGLDGAMIDREIDMVVYLHEHGAAACTTPLGYEATIMVGAGGLEHVTLRPLTAPVEEWVIRPASAIWRVAEAYLMVLPALRHRMAIRPVQNEFA